MKESGCLLVCLWILFLPKHGIDSLDCLFDPERELE